MIKSITVINNYGERLKLILSRPEKSGFIVEKVEGLGPGTANITSTDKTSGDGAFFNDARIPARNIVLNLTFLWFSEMTIEELRHLTSKYFPLKEEITLIVETDTRIGKITGRIEKNEPDIFSSSENTMISVICFNPYFRSFDTQEVIFTGLENMFEFPFCNDALKQNLLEMSSNRTLKKRNIVYEGDSTPGITVIMDFLGEVGNIRIYDVTSDEYIGVDVSKIESVLGRKIRKGDRLIIQTATGNKAVKIVSGDKVYNVLKSITSGTKWLTLSRGDNLFAYSATSGVDNIQFKMEYDIYYEGM